MLVFFIWKAESNYIKTVHRHYFHPSLGTLLGIDNTLFGAVAFIGPVVTGILTEGQVCACQPCDPFTQLLLCTLTRFDPQYHVL